MEDLSGTVQSTIEYIEVEPGRKDSLDLSWNGVMEGDLGVMGPGTQA